jgi:hypothetical protein
MKKTLLSLSLLLFVGIAHAETTETYSCVRPATSGGSNVSTDGTQMSVVRTLNQSKFVGTITIVNSADPYHNGGYTESSDHPKFIYTVDPENNNPFAGYGFVKNTGNLVDYLVFICSKNVTDADPQAVKN